MADTNDTKIRTDYTEGSILKSILHMGLPSMFGFLSQHVYSITDMFWISRLPGQESSVAAITFFNNLLWFLFAFNGLIGPGSVAIISRRYGEKDYAKTEIAIKETIFLKLFFGAVVGATGYYFLEQFLYMVGAREVSLQLAISYGEILIIGLPFLYAAYSIFTAMRGVANPRMAMLLMIISSVVNMALDPLLIFGYFGFPELGIKGAAWATLISYTSIFIVGLLIFKYGNTNINFHLFKNSRLSIASMWKIVKIGIPAMLGDMSYSGSRLILTPIIASFGTAVIAAYGVGIQVYAFGVMIIVGIGLGLSSLIGHNLGARKIERAKKTGDQSVMIGFGIMAVFGLLVYFLGEYYLGIFFKSPETIRYGTVFLKIGALSFPFVGAFVMMEMVYSGVGLNTPYMIASMIQAWGLQVVPIVIATQVLSMGFVSIWWIFTIASIVAAVGFYFYYRKGHWLTVKV